MCLYDTCDKKILNCYNKILSPGTPRLIIFLTFFLAEEDKEQHNVIQTSMILHSPHPSLFHILINSVVHSSYWDKNVSVG